MRAFNLFDVLDPKGKFRRLARIEPEDLYNLRLKKGWTAGLAQELKILQASIRLAQAFLVRRLVPYWRASSPNLIVSLIPNFNRPLIDSLNIALPAVPYLTVMTDLADHPPNFWIEPDTAQHIACGTDRAVAQARSMGVPEQRIHRTSGMMLHPDFYGPVLADVAAVREELGLEPGRLTGVVMFGGHGAPAMETIAQQLHDVQLVLMCGHNDKLAARLRRTQASAPRAVLSFTPQVRRYMQVGDFFVGKPGPGGISEAVHLGLPVITFKNRWTMPQERYNPDWVVENRLGVVVNSARAIRPAVMQLLNDLESYRSSVHQVRNVAVFDVVDIMSLMLAGVAQQAAGTMRIA